jgi:hypothetical protein
VGELGNGTSTTTLTVPTKIGSDVDWQSVSSGTIHTMAIKKDGSLWATGDNTFGTLGDNTNVGKKTFTKVSAATDWLSISAGNQYNLALKKDGTIWTFGNNLIGVLGDGTTTPVFTPKKLSPAVCAVSSVEGVENEHIKLFPNPAYNTLTFEGIESINATFSFYNTLGQMVKTMKQQSNALDISALPAGMYNVQITSNESRFVKQFVKL